MEPRMRAVAVAMAAAALTSFFVTARSGLSAQETSKSAKDGAYTAEQAARGKAEYAKNCGSCHKDDMSGSTEAPALAGEKFILAWQDRSVGDLYTLVRTTMPYDQPESLSPKAYLDIVASMLQRNNYPAGKEELHADAEALKNLMLR
jgi:mono/diheme cytochrome c family protein